MLTNFNSLKTDGYSQINSFKKHVHVWFKQDVQLKTGKITFTVAKMSCFNQQKLSYYYIKALFLWDDDNTQLKSHALIILRQGAFLQAINFANFAILRVICEKQDHEIWHFVR